MIKPSDLVFDRTGPSFELSLDSGKEINTCPHTKTVSEIVFASENSMSLAKAG